MRVIKYMINSLLLFAMFIAIGSSSICASEKKAAPQKVVVSRYSNRALKLEWKKEKNATGYKVYKYDRKTKKYFAIKTIYNNKQNKWIDRGLKIHRTYKYKVCSFQLKKGKKIFSKRSYPVSARTYGKKGKKVNVEDISIEYNSPVQVGICSELELYAILTPDTYTKNKKARPFSKKVKWTSDNNRIVKINKDGKITTYNREGTCNIYLRAHNGVTEKVKIKVVNFARPTSFPYYEGKSESVNMLFMNYREEAFNIATYFTQYAEKGKSGIIESDENGNIVGIPRYKKISTITKDIEKLISEFPSVMKIAYSDEYVKFQIHYDSSGYPDCQIIYYKWDDCEDSILKIAPHWMVKRYLEL